MQEVNKEKKMAEFQPVSNGFSFACTASYNLLGTANKSQLIQAEHVNVIGEKTSEANHNLMDELDKKMVAVPTETTSDTYAQKMQQWQTEYNNINTKGQMITNALQTEAQNGGTNLQAIGNFIQNLIQIQSAIISPLNTVTSLLQGSL